MRRVELYRFSLPMEAGVILRNQRLKTRDGLLVCLEENGRQGWGRNLPASGVLSGDAGRCGSGHLRLAA
ncbi:o-succinylbenzoate synthase [Leminorella grimontii]|nr:o-succinylbenzoate synthase [Leminorella grimontii]